MKTPCFFLLLSVILFCGCGKDDEIHSKDYPYILLTDVRDIDSTGATLVAKVIDYGKDKITDYGFKWTGARSEYTHSIKEENSTDDFIFRITSDLKKGTTYTCRAYIQTTKYLILSNEISFESLGTREFEIIDFYPKEGPDCTTVTMRGRYFSYKPSNNQVYIGDIKTNVIYSCPDSIVFQIPQYIYIGDVSITVYLGTKKIIAPSKFNILGPKIDSISPHECYPEDTISIIGKNFIQGDNQFICFNYLGANLSATIIDFEANKINIKVPHDFYFHANSNIVTDVILYSGIKSTIYKNYIIKNPQYKNP